MAWPSAVLQVNRIREKRNTSKTNDGREAGNLWEPGGSSSSSTLPVRFPFPGSALAYSAYVFPAEWVSSTFHHCYVPIAVFNTVVSTSLSCYSRYGAFCFICRDRYSIIIN